MDLLIEKYLEDCLLSDGELKSKILTLRKRGYSLDVSYDGRLKYNNFAWDLNKSDFIKLIDMPFLIVI